MCGFVGPNRGGGPDGAEALHQQEGCVFTIPTEPSKIKYNLKSISGETYVGSSFCFSLLESKWDNRTASQIVGSIVIITLTLNRMMSILQSYKKTGIGIMAAHGMVGNNQFFAPV